MKKFWGKKKFEKVRIPRRMWKHKDLRVSVYPELCFSYKDKVHIIKLFFSNDTKKISKNEADLLLEMMKETYGYDPNDVVYGILDCPKVVFSNIRIIPLRSQCWFKVKPNLC